MKRRRVCVLLALCAACSAGDLGDTGVEDGFDQDDGFDEMEGLTELPDVNTSRLCAESDDPDAADDQIWIDCSVETGLLGLSSPAPSGPLVVASYNVERGHELDGMVDWFLAQAESPDVILLSEADRGCARTDDEHITWELAEALGMNFVYAVEFLEVTGEDDTVTEVCEHGNAVLSRYAMGDVEAYRHTENVSWYTPPEERDDSWTTRLGGRIAVSAAVQTEDDRVHFTSVHFASGILDQAVREAQAEETIAVNAARPSPVIIGGDTNAGYYILDLSTGSMLDGITQSYFDAGYSDAHAPFELEDRVTAHEVGLVLDLIFGSEGVSFADAGICTDCGDFSDHYPIWATAHLP
jgi:endonuclease/exonuclease/phosphatase family metal-dependent hydrolase